MADRSLRGMRLGTQSMETVATAELAERITVTYDCPNGHVTDVPFSIEADIPTQWDCHCGSVGLQRNAPVEEETPDVEEKTPRTHWDMLLERRTIAELEDLLQERLEVLRSARAS